MRRALARIFSRHGAAALLLLVLLPAEPVSLALRIQEHRCECRHDACPMRSPVKAANTGGSPSCHGAGGHQAAQPAPEPSLSIQATCGCGLPHSPGVPHREARAVLEPVLAALLPLPAGLFSPPAAPVFSDLFSAPEPPPPRFLALA